MDQGTCKELGTPDELLSREGSVLRAFKDTIYPFFESYTLFLDFVLQFLVV